MYRYPLCIILVFLFLASAGCTEEKEYQDKNLTNIIESNSKVTILAEKYNTTIIGNTFNISAIEDSVQLGESGIKEAEELQLSKKYGKARELYVKGVTDILAGYDIAIDCKKRNMSFGELIENVEMMQSNWSRGQDQIDAAKIIVGLNITHYYSPDISLPVNNSNLTF
jgi:hypothetical protein